MEIIETLAPIVPQSLSRLFALANAITGEPAGDGTSAFGDIGLFLHPNLDYSAYRDTPANSTTFASTGGDGVHYGFLVDSEVEADDPPIVMTVPMNFERPNVIVGSNLKEFLSLGCRAGYFSLEQLVYDPVGTVLDLQSAEFSPDASSEEIELLTQISAEFDVSPWRDPGARLDELRSMFGALVDCA